MRGGAGRIGVVDYGASNLRSVETALDRLGVPRLRVIEPGDLGRIDGLVLPGVGRFGPAARRLRESGLAGALLAFIRAGHPTLGICLGMQILFESSEEDPGVPGLAVFAGAVRRLESERRPHIGWTLVEQGPAACGGILAGLPDRFFAYFAHSFAAPPDACGTAARAEAPPGFAAVVRQGEVWGLQFHPEKSGADGQRILAAFAVRVAERPAPPGKARR
jgi:glutamine amidotransferase